MKHAASVRPEPGSNSPLSEKFMSITQSLGLLDFAILRLSNFLEIYLSVHLFQNQQVFFVFSYSIFKVRLFILLALNIYLIQTVIGILLPPKFIVKSFLTLF